MTMGYYGSGDGLGWNAGVGENGQLPAEAGTAMTVLSTVSMIGATLSSPLLAYHGYKRNNGSVGWAVVWGLFGPMAWPIVDVVAFAQGYAKPRIQKNRRRRGSRRRSSRRRRTTRRPR